MHTNKANIHKYPKAFVAGGCLEYSPLLLRILDWRDEIPRESILQDWKIQDVVARKGLEK